VRSHYEENDPPPDEPGWLYCPLCHMEFNPVDGPGCPDCGGVALTEAEREAEYAVGNGAVAFEPGREVLF
jgi:hypothetical protein